ncbi:MAG: hypothetical protein RMJ57_06465 [Bacteroidia bacterium]|nr:hypothetical protein [Bacteroidia bacterium]
MACLIALVWAQNVGIGTATPTERLHVAGNLRLDNAFMPGNQPGAVGNILLSRGAGTAPVWLPNGPAGSILMSAGPGNDPVWAPNPICASPTLNRFIKFTSTSPVATCNTTLAENAAGNIWNVDGSAAPVYAGDKFEVIGTATQPYPISGYATANGAYGIYGQATGAGGVGVYGITNSSSGTGGFFLNAAAAGTGDGDGVAGRTAQSQGFGVWGINTNANGTGVVGAGNAATSYYLTNGSGGAFTGTNTGTYTVATTGNGVGIYSVNNAAYSPTATGGAGAFVSRAGGGSAVSIMLRNDASLGYVYYANTGLTVINMRSDNNPWGIAGAVANGGAANPGIGVIGINTSNGAAAWGVYANGRLGANGTKSFFIDHPLDPENKFLAHFALEGPEPYTIYRGTVTTDATGRAVVELPRYFEALNRPGDYHYSLTCIGTFAQAIVEEEIRNNRFVIRTDKPHVKVAWVVTGVRNDVYARHFWMADEVEKSPTEKGKYLIPELFGKGPEYGIFSSRLREAKIDAQEVRVVEASPTKLPVTHLPKGKLLKE